MRLVVERMPGIRTQMNFVLMRRLARYYWISLATSGSPASRVAAALISRLALNGEDYGRGREISVRQRDIVRLTVHVALRQSLPVFQNWRLLKLFASGTTTVTGSQVWSMCRTLTD